jgi:predicted ATP-binding protein involved in virulence
MILKSLIVEQYRGFVSRTSIEFHPSFTLIVGENGAGKTSVLWALRVLLSHILPRLVKKSGKILQFQPEDIAGGWPYLRAETAVNLDPEDMTATCVAQKNAAEFVPSTDKDGRPREHAVDTPDKYEVSVRVAASSKQRDGVSAPLVTYYSALGTLRVGFCRDRAMCYG